MKVTIAACAALTVVLCTVPALALSGLDAAARDEALGICTNPKSKPATGIEACSRLIDNESFGPKSTATLYYNRGAFHLDSKKYENAVADFTAAITQYDNDPAKDQWSADFKSIIMSSYFMRGRAKESLKQCDEARADFTAAAGMAEDATDKKKYEKAAKSAC